MATKFEKTPDGNIVYKPGKATEYTVYPKERRVRGTTKTGEKFEGIALMPEDFSGCAAIAVIAAALGCTEKAALTILVERVNFAFRNKAQGKAAPKFKIPPKTVERIFDAILERAGSTTDMTEILTARQRKDYDILLGHFKSLYPAPTQQKAKKV
jgi:hypothetical protein